MYFLYTILSITPWRATTTHGRNEEAPRAGRAARVNSGLAMACISGCLRTLLVALLLVC
jgi:hypothetical protein